MALTAPPRPTTAEVEAELAQHVRALAGPDAVPRPEQLAAVQAVVADGRRTLLVARTGFGKSAVYFSATRMLRDRGWGPTVVVSPLLALMRDQVASAQRLGLVAETINSSNTDEWDRIEAAITDDTVDLLLISPERLANEGFRERVFHLLLERPMALVCDEAHCISDWGHDFRPDYLRLRHLLDELPSWTPVLATTATANQRVTDDVASQLGSDALVLRTTLDREALHLSVVDLPDDAHRLAWVSEHLDELPGSGIVYCLTQEQAAQTAEWLRHRGHACEAYTGGTEPEQRLLLEEQLRANELKALVATSALGMGFDKGDLAFCVHLGLPPTPVAYYQQIGRAGRALERAEVVALPRPVEDAAIWRWFEQVSLPPESTCAEVLLQLSTSRPTSVPTLESVVNLGRSRLQTLLKILEVDGAIRAVKGGYVLADETWTYDQDKAERLRRLRREESEQMLAFADRPGCRLRFLREALDDAEAADCGRCDRCLGTIRDTDLDPELVAEAGRHLRAGDVGVEPRRQWPVRARRAQGAHQAGGPGPVGSSTVPGGRRRLGADDRPGPRRRPDPARGHGPCGGRRAEAVGVGAAAGVDLPDPVPPAPGARRPAVLGPRPARQAARAPCPGAGRRGRVPGRPGQLGAPGRQRVGPLRRRPVAAAGREAARRSRAPGRRRVRLALDPHGGIPPAARGRDGAGPPAGAAHPLNPGSASVARSPLPRRAPSSYGGPSAREEAVMDVHQCPRCELRFVHTSELRSHFEVDHEADPGMFEPYRYRTRAKPAPARTILLVGNQTLEREGLVDDVATRAGDGDRVLVLVPATHSGHDADARAESPPREDVTDTAGVALARHRLRVALDRLRAAGVDADGLVGPADPFTAVLQALAGQQVDEILLSTLHPASSRWLAVDLPGRLRRHTHRPVTVLTPTPI